MYCTYKLKITSKALIPLKGVLKRILAYFSFTGVRKLHK